MDIRIIGVIRVIAGITVVQVKMNYSNWGFQDYCSVSRVTWVISIDMVIRAIRLLSVVRVTPVISVVLML